MPRERQDITEHIEGEYIGKLPSGDTVWNIVVGMRYITRGGDEAEVVAIGSSMGGTDYPVLGWVMDRNLMRPLARSWAANGQYVLGKVYSLDLMEEFPL